MILQNVGQDGFESYHEDSDWGMDILKVGNSLGIGSIAFWNGEKAIKVEKTDSITSTITLNGNLKSEITTNYYGWNTGSVKFDLISSLSIDAGSYFTKHSITSNLQLENLCTGIVIHENAELFKSENTGHDWDYIATYGNKQSLADDNLGMVVFYRKKDFIQITRDEESHIVVLSPKNKTLTYYFGAIWEQGTDQIKTKEEFEKYLNHFLIQLENPIEIIR